MFHFPSPRRRRPRLDLILLVALLSLTCWSSSRQDPRFIRNDALASEPSSTPREFGGVYPSLAYFNDENECGTGAVVPWAEKLWLITYGPHLPNGSSDKLYAIDEDLRLEARPESVGGTNANRMIHRETNQLFIGNHVIDATGKVRTIPHDVMSGRLTATARSLTEPAKKVYFLTMEEGLYEVDATSLEATEICRDGNRQDKPTSEDVLPGYHGKGGYTSQGRLVYSNNGEDSEAARHDPTTPSGCLAQWTPEEGWNVVKRAQFTEVTGPDGIFGGSTGDEVLWTLGWDVRSVILNVLEDNEWREFRLPKASHCYDGAHGWNTEWPRIREIDDPETFLATMHGQFWKFPRAFKASNATGIRPRSSYLKVVGDFAYWKDRIVFGCDDTARSSFLNSSPLKTETVGPGRSGSNLWFVAPDQLDAFGASIGRGALWLNDAVDANVPTSPYLFAGYDRRLAFLKFDAATFADTTDSPDRVELTFEVDDGTGKWSALQTATLTLDADGSGFGWVAFDASTSGEWIRVKSNAALIGATCFFHYSSFDDRKVGEKASIFNGIAYPADSRDFLGARLWVRGDNDRLAVVSEIVRDGKVEEERYYELTEDGTSLERVECRFEGGESGTISRVKKFVEARPLPSSVLQIDELGVRLGYNGQNYRLPVGSWDAALTQSPLVCRVDREVVTERDLLHVGGTFYELPAENAGGVSKLRPVATDGRLIVDYASYRGLLVLAGIRSDASSDGKRIVRSEDGKCALWLGSIDDLWSFGKPSGNGYVWKKSKVVGGEPSEPILATGFDHKRVELANDSELDVVVTLEADPTCDADWRPWTSVQVPANGAATINLPDDFAAYWLRVVADRDAVMTAEFIYD